VGTAQARLCPPYEVTPRNDEATEALGEKSREPASVFAAAGSGWEEPAFMGGNGGRTPARAC